MTRDELNEVKAVVRRAIEEEREMYDEVWLTEKQLLEQFGMFTHDWLKKYGQCLQPARAIVVDEQGVEHPTQGWAYPKHKIQRMIASGEITKLRCRVVRMDQQVTVRVKVAMA
jgi:hypothetical protein